MLQSIEAASLRRRDLLLLSRFMALALGRATLSRGQTSAFESIEYSTQCKAKRPALSRAIKVLFKKARSLEHFLKFCSFSLAQNSLTICSSYLFQ